MSISRFRSLLLGLFYLTLASLPLSIDWYSHEWHLGLMVLAEPLMVLTVGTAVLGLLTGRLAMPLSSHRLDKLIGFHFGAMFLAAMFSSDLLVSAKYFLMLVLYLLFGYGIPRVLVLNRTEWLRAVAALMVGTSLLVAYVLSRHAQIGISYSISYIIAQPFSKNGHTNLTVLLEPLILVLNLMLLYHRRAQQLRGRMLVTLLLTAALMVVAFSYSRASYISLMAQALLLLAYTGWTASKRLLFPWAIAGLLILTAWQTLVRIYPNASLQNTHLLSELGTVSDFSAKNESNAERMSRWLFSLELYQQEPVIGVGPGTFPDRYLEFVRHTPNHPTYLTTLRRMNAHNLYLSWLVEAGALGLLSGLMLLGYLVGRQVRWAFRWRPTPIQVGFTVYFLYFLLHSLSQDFWQEPRVIVIFWLAIGLQRYYERPASYSHLSDKG